MSLVFTFRLQKTETLSDYLLAGLAVGLAASTKNGAIVAAVPLVVSHLAARKPRSIRQLWDAKLVLSILASGVAFALTSPFVLSISVSSGWNLQIRWSMFTYAVTRENPYQGGSIIPLVRCDTDSGFYHHCRPSSESWFVFVGKKRPTSSSCPGQRSSTLSSDPVRPSFSDTPSRYFRWRRSLLLSRYARLQITSVRKRHRSF